MYETDDDWPLKCPECRHEFTENIGRMEAGAKSQCPSCGLNVVHPREQFIVVLSQARAGAFNPWRDMLNIERPVRAAGGAIKRAIRAPGAPY